MTNLYLVAAGTWCIGTGTGVAFVGEPRPLAVTWGVGLSVVGAGMVGLGMGVSA